MQTLADGGELCFELQQLLLEVNGLERPLVASPSAFQSLGVGSKIRIATALCSAIKRLKYPHELNYSQLLYPSENDSNDLTSFLRTLHVDKQVGESREEEKTSPSTSPGWPAIGHALETWMKGTDAAKQAVPMLRRKSRMSSVPVKPIDETLLAKWKELESEYRSNAARLGRITSVAKAREVENEVMTQRVKALEKARQLHAADSDGNTQKLKEIVRVSRERLMELVKEWEDHRVPLITSLKEAADRRDHLMSEQDKVMEELAEMRKELSDLQERMADTSDVKSEPYVPGKGSEMRGQVVLRVLDSVRQLKKQTAEIDKVVKEVREVQTEFAVLSERLVAVENSMDDLLFTEAKRHPFGLEAYEFFVELVEMFDELLQFERATHQADIEYRDRVARCHSVAARVSALKLESVMQDLQKMKQENQALREQTSQAGQ